jgi:hypothetical protein
MRFHCSALISEISKLPETMNAVVYSEPRKFEIKGISFPEAGDDTTQRYSIGYWNYNLKVL